MMATIGATATPAYANTTINGCTVVAHPTATRFTDCPGADLAGANLSGVNLFFANLSDAQFIACPDEPPYVCGDIAVLTNTDLKSANLSGANLSGVNLSGANLSHSNLSGSQPE